MRCVCMAHEQAVHAQMVLHAGYWYAVNGFLQIVTSYPGIHLTRVASISYSSAAKKVAELRSSDNIEHFRFAVTHWHCQKLHLNSYREEISRTFLIGSIIPVGANILICKA